MYVNQCKWMLSSIDSLVDIVRTALLLLFPRLSPPCVFVSFDLIVPSMKLFYIIQRHIKIYCQENVNCVSLKNAKLKSIKNTKFSQNRKFKCREICAPQNREINVSRKFHVIRYVKSRTAWQNSKHTELTKKIFPTLLRNPALLGW